MTHGLIETWPSNERVLVCGGRNFNNWGLLDTVLTEIDPEMIIQGGARGADSMAGTWAQRNRVGCIVEFANWDVYGKAAGRKRNQLMLDEHAPTMAVAFPGGYGTADMVKRSKAHGLYVIEVAG